MAKRRKKAVKRRKRKAVRKRTRTRRKTAVRRRKTVRRKRKATRKKPVRRRKKKAARKKPVRRKRKKAVKKTKTVRRKKRKTAKRKKGRGRKSGLMMTTCSLSPQLQAVVRSKKLTRPQLMKKIWAYIKSHKCQDKKNRRMICPDAKLAKIIGNRPIDMLKLAGCLNKHVNK